MARKVVDVLSGFGDIYAADELLRKTTYRLEVFAEDGEAGGPPVIEGSIDITGMGEAIVLAGPRELTLELEDGRRMPFTLTSTTGRIRVLPAPGS
jgi:hypothetical protein